MNKFHIIVSGLVDSREVLGKSSIIALILSVFHLVMKTMQFTVLLVMLTKSFGGVFFGCLQQQFHNSTFPACIPGQNLCCLTGANWNIFPFTTREGKRRLKVRDQSVEPTVRGGQCASKRLDEDDFLSHWSATMFVFKLDLKVEEKHLVTCIRIPAVIFMTGITGRTGLQQQSSDWLLVIEIR